MLAITRFPLFCCLLVVSLAGCVNGDIESDTSQSADTVFLNGAIYTADARQRTVQAMAVTGDRISYIGDDESARQWIGSDTRVIDLEGRRVIPGLHDSHIHPPSIIELDDCNLQSEAMDLAELASFVAACIERLNVDTGEWLTVKQWNFAVGNKPADGLRTLREALDRGAPDNPVLLAGNDGHHNATNSAGLALAVDDTGEKVGLNARTLRTDFDHLQPYVGVDSSGTPNGELNESAPQVLGVDGLFLEDPATLLPEVGQIPQRLNSAGITSIMDAAFNPDMAPLYDRLAQTGALSLRVTLAQHYEPARFRRGDSIDMTALLAQASELRRKYARIDNIRADYLKYFVDGVLEGNPLATPPTLPNAAQLEHFEQPRFHLAAGGTLELTGYVEPSDEACAAIDVDALENLTVAAQQAFLKQHGFHPAQCLRSNGVMFQPREITLQFARAATEAGFHVHFHAIGDRAVRTAVDAIETVTEGRPDPNPHSIAHLQLIHPADIQRLAQLRIPLAFTYAWAGRDYEYDLTVIPFIERLDSLDARYDADSYYMRQVYPAGSVLRAGGVLTAGSDAPVDTADPRPYFNIEVAVTRDIGQGALNAGEGLAIRDALDAYTINGARMLDQADLTGSLEVGKKADFVLLDRDIIALAESGRADNISETQVIQTWFDGRPVYIAEPAIRLDQRPWKETR